MDPNNFPIASRTRYQRRNAAAAQDEARRVAAAAEAEARRVAAAAEAEARRRAEIERQRRVALGLEQEDAYQESIRKDQEKARIKREQEEAELEKERAKKRKREENSERHEILMAKKESVRDTLKPEPAKDHPDTVRILLRLPNGKRVERRFLTGDSLYDLHDFVLSLPESPEFFELGTTYPKRRLRFHHEHDTSSENKKQKTTGAGEGDQSSDGVVLDLSSMSLDEDGPTFTSFGILKNELITVYDLGR